MPAETNTRAGSEPTGDSLSKLGVDALSRTRPFHLASRGFARPRGGADPGFVSDGSPDVESLQTADPGHLVPAPHPRLRIPPRFWLRAIGRAPGAATLRLLRRDRRDRGRAASARSARRRRGAGGAARRAPHRARRSASRARSAISRDPSPRRVNSRRSATTCSRPTCAPPSRRCRTACRRARSRKSPRSSRRSSALRSPRSSPSSSASRSAPRRSRRCTARDSSRGEVVAVKVQFPWLAYSLPADLAIARLLLRATRRSQGAREPRAALRRVRRRHRRGTRLRARGARRGRDRREPRGRPAGRGARRSTARSRRAACW